MNYRASLVAASLAILLTASSAWAACVQTDLQGTWQAYVGGVDGLGYPYWMRCTIQIGATGTIAANKPCKDSDDVSYTTTAGGKLTVTQACIVTGTVKIGGVGSTVKHATLSKGKDTVAGVGIDGELGGFVFNAVKQ